MNLSPPDLLLIALATWYLAYVVTKTSGPFEMMGRFRFRFPLGGLTACIVCAAPWLAAALYLLYRTPLQPIVVVLALAGAALMLGSFSGASHSDGT